MKRINWLLFSMFLIIATPAYCGVWESFKNNAIEGAITLIFVVLSGILGKKVMDYKKVVNDLYATFREFKTATGEKSVGGKEITKEEWDGIIAKLVTAFEDIFAIIPVKWLPKKG
jgi:hypothetical protein